MATQKKFVVKNGLIASDLSYPTSDGTANQTIVTDGAGNLSFSTAGTAETLTFTGKNTTGSTIAKGTVVYVSDLSGNTPEISLARANSSSTMPAFGLVTADIGNNNNGAIDTFGSLRGLNVANFGETGITFALGDTLYVSASEAGKLTNVPPAGEANLIQNIGKIERATPTTNMTIKVGGAGRTNATSALNDGNIFIGNSSNQSSTAALNTSIVPEGSNLYYTDARADARVALIVDAAPSTLDTLNELAAALGDDANFSTTVTNSIATKLPLAGGTITGDVSFTDGNKAVFGTGSDLQIYHTGGTSVINDVGTGRLFIGGSPGVDIGAPEIDEYYIRAYNDGAVELYYNNAKKLETTSTGIDVTGRIIADGRLTVQGTSSAGISDISYGSYGGGAWINSPSGTNAFLAVGGSGVLKWKAGGIDVLGYARFADNNKAMFGTGSDLQIYHDGSNSYIDDAGQGVLAIRSNSVRLQKYTGEEMVQADADGAVILYHNNVVKFATTATGIDVTGTTTTDQYLYVNSPNGTQLQLRSEDAYTTLGVGNRNLNISANRTIFLDDAFAEVMRINDDGKVGIGTATPATALHVRGTASTVGATRSVVTLTDDTAMGINVGSGVAFRGLYTSAGAEANYGGIFAGKANANSGNANGYLSLSYSASGTLTEGIRISETGKVGIGDSTPTANGLTLFSSVTGAVRLNLHIGGTGTVPNSGSYNTISNNNHGDILISSNAYINGSGNPVITSNHANMGGTGIKISGANGSHDIKFYTSNAASVRGTELTNTERMTISSTGNVGIGTSSPAVNLHIQSGGTPQVRIQDTDGTNQFTTIAHNNGLTTFNSRNNTASGSIAFRGINSNAEFVRIDASGNVGIGTATPSTKLDISTSGADGITLNADTVTATASSRLFFNNGTAGKAVGLFNSFNALRFTVLATPGTSTGTEKMRLTEAGFLSLGGHAPATVLDIANVGGAHGLALNADANNATLSSRLFLNNGTAGKAISIMNNGNNLSISTAATPGSGSGSEKVRILENGNVGIGTTNPTVRTGMGLVINGGTNQARLALKNDSTGDSSTDGFQIVVTSGSGSNGGQAILEQRENNIIAFKTNGSEAMRILPSGNVGIGEVNPLHPLHVDGTIYSTNNIQLNSTKQVLFGNGNQYIKGTNDTSIEIGTGGTATITATHAGDVLIGSTTNTNTGLLQVDGAISAKVHHELFTVGTIASNIVSLDLNTGTSVVTVASPGANFSLAITNVPNTGNTTTGIAIIVTQGGSPFIPNALTVNGSAVTINWLGGSAPAGTASKTEIFSFTVINTGGVFTALGSVSTFG